MNSRLENGFFTSPPSVLLAGPYSTGKTTFLKHILQFDYPGSRIGTEPTSEKFSIINTSSDKNANPKLLSGNIMVLNNIQPWKDLDKFGDKFLGYVDYISHPSENYADITFIDTPGILSEPAESVRGYNYSEVITWFAAKVDLVFLFFDANKLDLPQQVCDLVKSLSGYANKLCIILNKADIVSCDQLLRVYGALMWNLSRVIMTPELPRLYIGSFTDEPYFPHSLTYVFENDALALYKLLLEMPYISAKNKINLIYQRTKNLYAYCLLVDKIYKNKPFLRKKSYISRVKKNLSSVIDSIVLTHDVNKMDFPDAEAFTSIINSLFTSKFDLNIKKITKSIVTFQANISEIVDTLPADFTLVCQSSLPACIKFMNTRKIWEQNSGINMQATPVSLLFDQMINNRLPLKELEYVDAKSPILPDKTILSPTQDENCKIEKEQVEKTN